VAWSTLEAPYRSCTNSNNRFTGLALSSSSGFTIFDGSPHSAYWWNAVGSRKRYQGHIPAALCYRANTVQLELLM